MRTRRFIILTALVAGGVSTAALAAVEKGKTGNPGVRSGGQPLTTHATPLFPPSLIGAIGQCTVIPWRWLASFKPRPYHPHPPY